MLTNKFTNQGKGDTMRDYQTVLDIIFYYLVYMKECSGFMYPLTTSDQKCIENLLKTPVCVITKSKEVHERMIGN